MDQRRRRLLQLAPLTVMGAAALPREWLPDTGVASVQTQTTGTREILSFSAQDGGRSRGIYHLPAGPRPKTALILMHPRANMTEHFLAAPLSAGGYGVLGCASRWENNDSDARQEATLLDIAAAIKVLKERFAVERVVSVGHSGGAALFAFYQGQAVLQPPRRFSSAPSGDPPDLNKFDLPMLDGSITVNGHRGEGPAFLEMLDPSIIDEATPTLIDPSLDIFDPRNGYQDPPSSSRYSQEFLTRYRAAQLERHRRLDAKAYAFASEQSAAASEIRDPSFARLDVTRRVHLRRQAYHFRYLVIHGTWASPLFTDLTIDPSDRVVSNAETLNGAPGAQGRTMTARGFLSTWSGLSSRMLLNENVANIKAPTLVVAGTADNVICGREYFEKNFAACASSDKQLVWIKGGDHGMLPVKPAAGDRDTQAETAKAILDWLRPRFST